MADHVLFSILVFAGFKKSNINYDMYMDHNVLLERALDVAMMIKA